ncbi:ABC transporter E family member 2 [Tanacetum coccineum]
MVLHLTYPKQSHTPQYVDHIPKVVQGNVGQVLEQKNERDVLQRFAIAVVAMQMAEIYMFDEPSSYLDVKQRLKAAQAGLTEADDDVMNPLQIEHPNVSRVVKIFLDGELQRSCNDPLPWRRQLNIYLIDEPSAHLDSEQRIVASKVINKI